MGEKWNDSRPAEKLLALYTMLMVSPAPMSLTAIAKRLDCSKQTICRLVDQLESSNFGKVIRDKDGRQIFYRLDKPSRNVGISLNAQGLTQLALCREFLLKMLPPSMSRLMETSLNQAACYLPQDDESFVSGIGASAVKGRIDYTPFEKIITTFMHAIVGKRVCSVAYRAKRNQEAKKYDFAPKRLVSFHESIFVYGYIVNDRGRPEPLYDDPTLLAVHRFVSCSLTQRKTDKIPEPEMDNPFLGIMADTPFEVVVKFAPQSATYAAERQWSKNQVVEELPDGSIILRAMASNAAECVSWIFSFGETAEVLEPAWFREQMAQKIRSLADMYGITIRAFSQ